MVHFDIRWRPSGGRGEYEHVPGDVALARRLLIDPIVISGSLVTTDVRGRIKDGKPRLRRENPNDRSLLNVHTLVAALALLPNPIREDKYLLSLPLQDGAYVISSVKFQSELVGIGEIKCRPLLLQVLHDVNTIDVESRLRRIGEFISRNDLSGEVLSLVARYKKIIQSGVAVIDLRLVADELIAWLAKNPEIRNSIDQPSSIIESNAIKPLDSHIELQILSADETNRRLVSHFKIDRDPNIRKAKIAGFVADHGKVFCENCEFDFEKKYGVRGKGYIEVHHLEPLAKILPNTLTYLSDLMLLCANCHRIVHRTKTPISKTDLQLITVP
ncbi:HNH endonuclease [Glacieibacterium frigidum]|uniref:HNH endonuclease n=1 Tax=Glacieibacterium frigidum TaxID=2593303 RepID=UPI00163DAFBD|nr:HNH endonuclease [Glacieibacterium frigidum]